MRQEFSRWQTLLRASNTLPSAERAVGIALRDQNAYFRHGRWEIPKLRPGVDSDDEVELSEKADSCWAAILAIKYYLDDLSMGQATSLSAVNSDSPKCK